MHPNTLFNLMIRMIEKDAVDILDAIRKLYPQIQEDQFTWLQIAKSKTTFLYILKTYFKRLEKRTSYDVMRLIIVFECYRAFDVYLPMYSKVKPTKTNAFALFGWACNYNNVHAAEIIRTTFHLNSKMITFNLCSKLNRCTVEKNWNSNNIRFILYLMSLIKRGYIHQFSININDELPPQIAHRLDELS